MQNDFFRDVLHGNKPLWFMFWIMNIGVFCAGGLILALIIYTSNDFLIYIWSLILIGYFFLVVFGTWRSANKYQGNRIFVVLVKFFIIVQCLGMASRALLQG